MSEIRQNIATKEWVIIATERAQRPEDFAEPAREPTHTRPAHLDTCPLCAGNEHQSQGEVLRLDGPDGLWRVRVVSNKFPALAPQGGAKWLEEGFLRRVHGFGFHEVLVESPHHNDTLALLSIAEVARVLAAFREVGRLHAAHPAIRQIVPFKNHGAPAGSSLEHPHGQLMSLPIVPAAIRTRLETAQRYYDESGRCVYCDMVREETRSGLRMLAENEHFAAFIPFAAFSPFHTWIVPKIHRPQFLQVTDQELDSLAEVLRDVLARMYRGLGDPPYNAIIRMAPQTYERVHWFHWYLSLVPRTSKQAGFELGSGMYINTTLPEDSAAFLRAVAL
ncbi:MAG TPA: galactose-1-phosphate uridylyltransferase [Myxococcota bacterium]|nr:galactose-1-phosphate uridylyltransferase [Myxococcota bacterium]HRY95207.1 galactose-1-phosphate uridylyltransferase [Myxococcota bacterium]HSA20520.1 galactose-1-phosphate uridylyltransferase [Myxococcota bacterium]